MGSRPKFRLTSECSQVSMCPSCHENTYSEVADVPAELGPRRMTKYSLSESLLAPQYSELQKQYSDIVLSYHKLKISFTVMLILNAILLVVVITCMVFIIPHISSLNNEDRKSNPGYPITTRVPIPTPKTGAFLEPSPSSHTSDRNPTINCQLILEKLGRLYKNGQKVESNVFVSLEQCTMGDFMDSFMQYIKSASTRQNTKAAFHFKTEPSDLSQCNRDSRLLKCVKNWEVKMKTTDISVNGESIIVPEDGVYFMYNRVAIVMDVVNATSLGDIIHSLRHSDTGSNFKDIESSKISCLVTNKRFNHVSYIEQIKHLKRGDELKIALSTPSSKTVQSIRGSSSFGMFQL